MLISSIFKLVCLILVFNQILLKPLLIKNLTDIEYDEEIKLDKDLQEDLDEYKKVEYYSKISSCLLIIRDSLSKGNSDIDIAMTECKNPDRKKVFDKIVVMMMESCIKNIKKAGIKFVLSSENIDKIYYKFSKILRFDVYNVSDKATNEITFTAEEKKILDDIQEISRNQDMTNNLSDKNKSNINDNSFDKETYVIYGGTGVAIFSILTWVLTYYLSSRNNNDSSKTK